MRVYSTMFAEDITTAKLLTEEPNQELHKIIDGSYVISDENTEGATVSDLIDQCRVILLARSMGLL